MLFWLDTLATHLRIYTALRNAHYVRQLTVDRDDIIAIEP